MVDRPAGGSQPNPSGQSRGRHSDTLETKRDVCPALNSASSLHISRIFTKKCNLYFNLYPTSKLWAPAVHDTVRMPLSQTVQTVMRRMEKDTREVAMYFLRWPMWTVAVQTQMCWLLKTQDWTRTDREILVLFSYPSVCLLLNPQFALPHLSHGICEGIVTFTRTKASLAVLSRQRQEAQSTVNIASSRIGKATRDKTLMQWCRRQAWQRTHPWPSKELQTVQIQTSKIKLYPMNTYMGIFTAATVFLLLKMLYFLTYYILITGSPLSTPQFLPSCPPIRFHSFLSHWKTQAYKR